MAGTCTICGGLIPASNEVLGYAGPICSGHHAQQLPPTIITLPQAALEALSNLTGSGHTKEPLPPSPTNQKAEE